MPKTSLIGRLTAFGASAAITLAIVVSAANHGLPADDGARMLVLANVAAVGR